MYSLRAYNEDAHTNVLVSSFSEVAPLVWVASWPRSCRKPGARFVVYPGSPTQRFIALERGEMLCVYHKNTLLTWVAYDHVVHPCFESSSYSRYSSPQAATKRLDEEDDEQLWLVRGESKELCKDALIMAQCLFHKRHHH
jgi:hypothetical protein